MARATNTAARPRRRHGCHRPWDTQQLLPWTSLGVSFATLYGLRIYWAFGATLALASITVLALDAPVTSGAFAGAMIEYAFGTALFRLRVDGHEA